MEKDPLSPEERLLRFIRKKPSKPEEKSQASKTPEVTLPKSTRAKISLWERASKLLSRGKEISSIDAIRGANRVLRIFLVILVVYFLLDTLMPRAQQVPCAPLKLEEKALPEAQEKLFTLKPYSYYAQEIGKRPLFSPLLIKEEKGAERRTSLKELTTSLRLVGIIQAPKQQAIIEDGKSQKTYFLYAGDFIDEVELAEILDGKVILSYEGEEIELFL